MSALTVGSIQFSPNCKRELARDIEAFFGTFAAPWSATLPWPPSVNHYWRQARGRVYISAEGRTYRSAVAASIFRKPPLRGRLKVEIVAHPPDNRKRDLDNVLKALLDALCKAGVYVDDSQIDDLRIVRGESTKRGLVTVSIRELEEQK